MDFQTLLLLKLYICNLKYYKTRKNLHDTVALLPKSVPLFSNSTLKPVSLKTIFMLQWHCSVGNCVICFIKITLSLSECYYMHDELLKPLFLHNPMADNQPHCSSRIHQCTSKHSLQEDDSLNIHTCFFLSNQCYSVVF